MNFCSLFVPSSFLSIFNTHFYGSPNGKYAVIHRMWKDASMKLTNATTKKRLNMPIFCGLIWMPFFTQRIYLYRLFVVIFYSICSNVSANSVLQWNLNGTLLRFDIVNHRYMLNGAFFPVYKPNLFAGEEKTKPFIGGFETIFNMQNHTNDKPHEFSDPIWALFIVVDGLCGQTPKFQHWRIEHIECGVIYIYILLAFFE